MPSSGGQKCARSEEHTSELQSHDNLVCRLLLEKKNHNHARYSRPPHTPTHPPPPSSPARLAGAAGGVDDSRWGGCEGGRSGVAFFFFLRMGRPPKSTLFPSTPLFR